MSKNFPVLRKPRFETNATVVLRSGSGDSYGAIANLHDEGAMIKLESRLAAGEIVSFVLAGAEIYAQIAWNRDNHVGLSFFRPIPAEVVAELLGEHDTRIVF